MIEGIAGERAGGQGKRPIRAFLRGIETRYLRMQIYRSPITISGLSAAPVTADDEIALKARVRTRVFTLGALVCMSWHGFLLWSVSDRSPALKRRFLARAGGLGSEPGRHLEGADLSLPENRPGGDHDRARHLLNIARARALTRKNSHAFVRARLRFDPALSEGN